MSRPHHHRKAITSLALLLLLGCQAFGRPSKTAAIDNFCATIRHEFVEAVPRYFSGPDPWMELGSLPDSFADAAIASVYSEGPRITWVVLVMSGPGDGWFQTTHYFFDEFGLIKKRQRYYQHLEANVKIEETLYFEKGKLIKTRFHHATLAPGRENWDAFFDPHAPEYLRTEDLPVLFFADPFKSLALSKARSGLRTSRTGCTYVSSPIPAKIHPSGNQSGQSDRLEINADL